MSIITQLRVLADQCKMQAAVYRQQHDDATASRLFTAYTCIQQAIDIVGEDE